MTQERALEASAPAGRSRWKCAALVGLLAAGLGGGAAPVDRREAPAPRLQENGRHATTRADWVTTDGGRVVFGSGTDLALARGGPALRVQRRISLAGPVSDALLVGHRLFFVQDDTKLGVLDLEAAGAAPEFVRLEPEARGVLRLAHINGRLLVSEDRYGLRVLSIRPSGHASGSHPGAHGQVHGPLDPIGFLALDQSVTSIAAATDRAFLVLDRTTVAEVQIKSPEPRIVRKISTTFDIQALAANDSSLYLLGTRGMRVLARDGGTPEAAAAGNPEITGQSVALAGRVIYIASGASGVTALRDTSAQSQGYSVLVENDFFSPRVLQIEVGDTVQWTNASGLHNVFSCIPEQLGCDTTATETFVSGAPAQPIWFYSYTFQLPGSNPYICQSHAPFMTGLVEVSGSPVPTVSGQGRLALLLLLLTASTAVLFRRRRPTA